MELSHDRPYRKPWGNRGKELKEEIHETLRIIAERHNALGKTGPLETQGHSFHDRPFQVIAASRFVEAIKAQISDPQVAAIHTNIGSTDQFSRSSDLRSYPRLHKIMQSLYK